MPVFLRSIGSICLQYCSFFMIREWAKAKIFDVAGSTHTSCIHPFNICLTYGMDTCTYVATMCTNVNQMYTRIEFLT